MNVLACADPAKTQGADPVAGGFQPVGQPGIVLGDDDDEDGVLRVLATTESSRVVLDRDLAATGVFPAIDPGASRTRLPPAPGSPSSTYDRSMRSMRSTSTYPCTRPRRRSSPKIVASSGSSVRTRT